MAAMIKKITRLTLIFCCVSFATTLFSQKGNIRLQQFLNSPKNNFTDVYVAGDHDKIRDFVKENGGVVKYSFSGYLAVHISSKALGELSRQQWVKKIYFDTYRPVALNDSMRLRNNIDSVHNGYAPLHEKYTGKNVIFGFIDTGVDFMHPDFMDSAGNSRVVSIWDQSMAFDATRTPPQYGYGQLWDSSDINAGICMHVDDSGHGTNVTGCGAGNGLASGTHRGAAPDANIVIVESDFSATNWLATIADGVDYIFNYADSKGMPAVINISLGTYEGSHDGRDLPALYIDSLIRAKGGRLVFAAAGNSGNIGSYHLETTVDSDTSFTWFNYTPSGQSALGYGAVFFEVWADTADLNNVQYAVGMDDSSGGNYRFRGRTDFFNVLSNLGTTLTDTITNGVDILAIVDYYAELQGDHYLLQVHLNEPDSNQYLFRFMTTGNGRFDVWTESWMGTAGMMQSGSVPTVAQYPDMVNYVAPDSSKIIVSSFTCLSSVITVGNYVNNSSYVDYAGNTNTFPITVGEISVNSSRGPTRDNRVKPDVVSPGDPTFAAGILWVLTFWQTNDPTRISPDGWHMRNGGTSLATPSVAGTGALMLEKCPSMNWQDFKTLLTGNAKADSFTGTTPNQSYGYGKVNAFRTLVATEFTPAITGDTLFCNGQSTVLTVDMFYDSYLWNTGDTSMSITVDSTMMISYSATNSNGCRGWSDTVQITESSSLTLSLTQGGVLNQFLFASLTGGINYDWYNNNNLVNGLEGDTVLIPSGGDWFVVMTDAFGCSYTSDTVMVIMGVEEAEGTAMEIYPNPNNGVFTCRIPFNEEYSLELYNGTGQILFSDNYKGMKGYEFILPDGVYFIKLSLEKGIYSGKIIVMR